MSYVHPFSKRCDKSEIDLFRVPPTQQSLERGRWIDYAPLSSVENPDSAITYLIAGTDEYIDLSKTILTVRGEITKGDGTKLTGGGQTDVAPVNNFLHSLFRQVDVYLNGKQVTPAMGTYPYRAYIETLLNYDASAKESQFTSALYYKDTATKMDDAGALPSAIINPAVDKDDQLDFDEAYNTLFSGTGKIYSNAGLDINRDEYPGGFALYAFDLTPDMCKSSEYFNTVQRGSLSLALTFREAAKHPLAMVCYGDFENVIRIDAE